MDTTVFSGRDFNQHSSEARKAANNGPVFITDRGKPVHVLMSFDHYQHLTGTKGKIADLLAMPEDVDMELELQDRSNELARPADFS